MTLTTMQGDCAYSAYDNGWLSGMGARNIDATVHGTGFSAFRLHGLQDEVKNVAAPVHMVLLALTSPGQITTNIAGIRQNVSWRSGDAVIVPASTVAWWKTSSAADVLHMDVDAGLLKRLLPEANGKPIEIRSRIGVRDPEIERIGRSVVRELAGEAIGTRPMIESLALALAVRLVRMHSNFASVSSGTPLVAWRLRRATEFMTAHLDRDIGLVEIAGAVGLSPWHFARAFREATGVPPHRWLVEKRIERARDLLANSTMRLAEVALASGFSSQSSFTTTFRRLTGATPGRWRERAGSVAVQRALSDGRP